MSYSQLPDRSKSAAGSHHEKSSSESNHESLLAEGEHHDAGARHKKDSAWLRRTQFILFHICCILWIAPIVLVMFWNASTKFIGASAYCPDEKCWPELFSNAPATIARSLELNRQSHNLLGWLQLVAKALEIWFVIIVSSLVFSYYRVLARRPEGLPTTYLFWPVNFVNVRSYFSVSLWSSAYKREKSRRKPLLVFVVITLLLGILCNLIGPAVAVLIIPSLQWLPVKAVADEAFDAPTSASPPTSVEVLRIGVGATPGAPSVYEPLCTAAELEAQNYYNCTQPISSNLGSLMDQYYSSLTDGENFNPLVEVGVVSSFLVNGTGTQPVLWTPNQQLLGHISNDRQIIMHMANQVQDLPVNPPLDLDNYKVYNRSLDMRVQRRGPTFGATVWNGIGLPTWLQADLKAWTTKVDSNRSVRCFPDYTREAIRDNVTTPAEFAEIQSYTRCIRIGSGWSPVNKQANFTVSRVIEQGNKSVDYGAVLTITFSDRATFFPGTEPPSFLPKACLSNLTDGVVPSKTSCDWDRFFTTDLPEGQAARSINANTWEFARVNTPKDPVLAFDFSVLVNFTDYTLDPTTMGNPLGLVETLADPETGTSVVVDPAWALLSWSADNGGVLPPDYSALYQLAADTEEDNLSAAFYLFPIAVFNMLSQLRYTTKPVLTRASKDSPQVLKRSGHVYAYAYALSGRTNYLAFVVGAIGVLVALVNLLVGILYRIEQASINDFTLAALEHHPSGNFVASESDSTVDKARFRVEEAPDLRGGLLFRRTTKSLV